jgi:hypothetical protein
MTELATSPLVRRTSPFVDLKTRRGATWLEPRLTVEVQYNDLTGGRLRAPVLRGFGIRRAARTGGRASNSEGEGGHQAPLGRTIIVSHGESTTYDLW